MRLALTASMASAFVGIMAISPLRDAPALQPLPLQVWVSAAALAVLAAPRMIILDRVTDRVLPPSPSTA